MKKRAGLCLYLLILVASLTRAQTVIENPSRPTNPRAGRIVTLEEVLRIEDTGGDFYLKSPRNIRVSPRGDIFVQDGQDQALLFDSRGRFVRNVLKKGQGPEEMEHMVDIWASEDRLFLLGGSVKILEMDYEGRAVRELKLQIRGRLGFVFANSERIVLYKQIIPDPSRGTGLINVPYEIIEISPADGSQKTIGTFRHQVYFEVLHGGATSITGWNQFLSAGLDAETILVNSTPEYLVEAFAWRKGEVIRRFNRPYKRVKRSRGGDVSGGGTAPPPPEFAPDINALHSLEGKILVQTSTVDKEKGSLFDVYDREGRYTDSFFLSSSGRSPSGDVSNKSFVFFGGFVYFRDKNEEDFVIIKKCRLVGF